MNARYECQTSGSLKNLTVSSQRNNENNLAKNLSFYRAASDKLMTTKITEFVHLYNSDVLLIVILVDVEEVSFFTDLHIG